MFQLHPDIHFRPRFLWYCSLNSWSVALAPALTPPASGGFACADEYCGDDAVSLGIFGGGVVEVGALEGETLGYGAELARQDNVAAFGIEVERFRAEDVTVGARESEWRGGAKNSDCLAPEKDTPRRSKVARGGLAQSGREADAEVSSS